MAKKEVFISYDWSNDRKYQKMIKRWDKNSEFDFSFYDPTVDISVDSTDSLAIAGVISDKINNATYFLCLVGEKTHQNERVAGEIDQAKAANKRLIGVKIEPFYKTPDGLLGSDVTWSKFFSMQSIKYAINKA